MGKKELGSYLKKRRLKANLKQKEVADKLGITSAEVCHYESGKRSISLETLIKLSDIYKVRVETIIKHYKGK